MHFLKWKFRKKIQINILAILVKFLKKEKYPLFFLFFKINLKKFN